MGPRDLSGLQLTLSDRWWRQSGRGCRDLWDVHHVPSLHVDSSYIKELEKPQTLWTAINAELAGRCRLTEKWQGLCCLWAPGSSHPSRYSMGNGAEAGELTLLDYHLLTLQSLALILVKRDGLLCRLYMIYSWMYFAYQEELQIQFLWSNRCSGR